jgi:hypothetical protein
MAFDFPASPTNGQSVTTPSGSVFIWDGVKWTASVAGGAGTGSVTSVAAGTGLAASPSPITGAGTMSLTVPVSVADGGTGSTTVAGSPFLPLTGGTVTGNLTVNNSFQSGTFQVRSASQCQIQTWRTTSPADQHMWEILHTSTGLLVIRAVNDAYSAASDAISIGRGAGVAVSAVSVNVPLRADSGRIMSIAGGGLNPSVTCYDTGAGAAQGIYANGAELRFGSMDGNGVPTVSWGWMTTNGFYHKGWIGAKNGDAYIGAGGNGTVYFFGSAANYYFDWNQTNGDLFWMIAGSTFMGWRVSDSLIWNARSSVGGYGAYVNLSDRRAKTNIEPSRYGLAELLRLEPVSFDRVPPPPLQQEEGAPLVVTRPLPREIGLIAQDVQPVIPEAVTVAGMTLSDGKGGLDDEAPSLGLTYDTILMVAINAIKELTARLEAAEAKLAA